MAACRERLTRRPDDILVTYVGSFAAFQGLDVLFGALPRVRRADGRVRQGQLRVQRVAGHLEGGELVVHGRQQLAHVGEHRLEAQDGLARLGDGVHGCRVALLGRRGEEGRRGLVVGHGKV